MSTNEQPLTSSRNNGNNPVSRSTVSGEYYLCSKAVIEHFPNLERSKPFKSGYEHDKEDEYYIVLTENFGAISKYYDEVIQPFNQKSTIDDIDFWLRECCASQLDASSITKKECRELGVFVAIERELNLTNERNRAYAIFSISQAYGLTPIEFINKIAQR
jgi:hypothetical protein